ncbi:MAG: Gfo/Idh/MocA family oxidoreductase [Planctomycetota bacterium]|nr:Gfo/Idh/MocA family oxidoreductase [Planctomycetota bacterium]
MTSAPSKLPTPSQPTNAIESKTEASRRTFLKATAATTAAATTASFLQRSAHAAGSDIIKVGLVGLGGRGMGAAKDAMSADAGCRLTSVAEVFYDRMENGREQLKKELGAQYEVPEEQCFSGWEALDKLLQTDINVVLLATPPGFRPAQMEAAVKAGKHVFCEKPVAVDPPGVRRVMAASALAESKGLCVVSGLCWRYDLGVKATIEKIQSGAIGEIISIQENYLTGTLWSRTPKPEWTPMHNQVLNWLYYRWLSGDHYVEQFIHSLDKAMWLHNDVPPVLCYGTGGRQVRTEPQYGDIYDHFSIVYEWADGTRCFATTRQMDGCYNQTEDFIYGTKGTSRVLANEIKGETNWKFQGKKPSMYQLEHIALMKAIRDGKPINNGDYMCKSTLMAIMGREAAYSGQIIKWDDAIASELKLGPDKPDWGPAPGVEVRMPGKYKFIEA